jgi:ankyrin repeat protein
MSSDDFGCSPLHWAANSGKPQIISSLIKKAHLSINDLQKKDQFGSTALHFASVRNLTENVQTLVNLDYLTIDFRWK